MRRNRLPPGVGGHPAYWLACGLGAGASPYAPGTAGTLVAVPLYLLLAPLALWAYGLAVAALFVLGVYVCDRTVRDFKSSDPGWVVWDEVVGYLVTMAPAPTGWVWALAGFALFRLFDVWKPFPIRRLERGLAGGLGVMADDVVAGIYAAAVLEALVRLRPGA